MTYKNYINPDFTLLQKLFFLLLAAFGVFLCILLIKLVNHTFSRKPRDEYEKEELHNKVETSIQLFFEMIISGASVMSFSCSYVVFNHIYSLLMNMKGSATYNQWLPFINIWSDGKDFALLLLICLSCVLNTILDKFIIPLKKIDKQKKASIRMLGMFYVIIILICLNMIGDESEYSPVMMYYLGLMVGRFVYFDASFMDFIGALKNILSNLHLLIMGLLLTGALCLIGFNLGYLLERNYYIVGIFYTHLFMLIVVFLYHHGYAIYKHFARK
ncbi:hypothetical protein [Butyrivibrio proteoclasticus]|uniref:hypothetical protein n=1 Tax=Butyrivibrio proteoclasticus TaxID=43305 RepID=UPI000A7008BC|nr:hypothetical protein [Butyrivibrio proteoclasticus]